MGTLFFNPRKKTFKHIKELKFLSKGGVSMYITKADDATMNMEVQNRRVICYFLERWIRKCSNLRLEMQV